MRTITAQDLTEVSPGQTPHIGIHPAHAITAAALVQGLMAFSEDTYYPRVVGGVLGNNSLIGRIGTSCDRWYSGCLLLALAAAPIVDALIDWDAFAESHGGVFTYEHVEVGPSETRHYKRDDCLSWCLFSAMEAEAWYEISENWRAPKREVLVEVIQQWCALNRIQTVGVAKP